MVRWSLAEPAWSPLYGPHPSHFIRHQLKLTASLMARWTWGLRLWRAARIKWQAWYLWTDGAARLNSHICSCAVAAVELSVGCGARGVRNHPLFGASVSQSAAKSLAFFGKWLPGCHQAPGRLTHLLLIPDGRQRSLDCCWFLPTWNPVDVPSVEERRRWRRLRRVVHLVYCSWFNLIKCVVWLSRSRVKGITHRGAACYEIWCGVICNRLWLWVAQYGPFNHREGWSLSASCNNSTRQRPRCVLLRYITSPIRKQDVSGNAMMVRAFHNGSALTFYMHKNNNTPQWYIKCSLIFVFFN